MYYSHRMKPIPQQIEVTDVFKGYNNNVRIGKGEFADMKNLTSDNFPVLSPRRPRQRFAVGDRPTGINVNYGTYATSPDEAKMPFICYTDGPKIYIGRFGSVDLGLNPDTPKRIIDFGKDTIVFPDHKYFTWQDGDKPAKDINAEWTGAVKMEMCTMDGATYTVKYTQDTAPEAPADGDYWINTSGQVHTLNRYSKALGTWASIVTVYIKVTGTGIGDSFNNQDGIKIDFTGAPGDKQLEALQGYNVIWSKEKDSIVIVGILDTMKDTNITVSRKCPEGLEFVFECNNRLWGVRENVIYASARGDFTNWHRFSGSADDSYYSEVGSTGAFTGGCAFRGHPTFFKENMIYTIFGVNPPFSIQPTQAAGVQDGCDRSVAVDNERVFYKSRYGVAIYTGSDPVEIGDPLGELNYKNASGGIFQDKYYISMELEGVFTTFVYDTKLRMWYKEDNFEALAMAIGNQHIYAIDNAHGEIVALDGDVDKDSPLADQLEPMVSWYAETGDLGITDSRQKYISRLSIRMELEGPAQVEVLIRYDHRKPWKSVHIERGPRLHSVSIPIRPERCDHMQLAFKGIGVCRIFSITKTIQKGSDRT